MNGAFYVGAVGLQAQQRALDLVSNNIANVNTPTFKRSDIRFSEMLAARADVEVASASPEPFFAPAGVSARAAVAIDEPGTVEATGRSMDLAIRGRGFIELMGPGGRTLLWRGGALKVGEDGLLAAADSGLPLRAAITVPADAAEILIDADGTVRAKTGDADPPVELGEVGLVLPRDGAALDRVDGGLFEVADDAAMDAVRAGEDGAGTLVQGAVERSNVEMTTQMVELMLVQRSYAANAQIVQAADQMMAIANGLRR